MRTQRQIRLKHRLAMRGIAYGCLCALMVLILSNTYKVASTGAPIGSTGAPGEYTCGRAGCHTGNNNINTGSGMLKLSIGGLERNYEPGKVYDITVSLEEEHIKRFGFSVSVLNKDGADEGSFIITEPDRTQVLAGSGPFENRTYVTYKSLGTEPYAAGKGLWRFRWKAPETAAVALTFYVAAVTANNDGTDDGDQVYTTSLPAGTMPTGVREDQALHASIFPNPVRSTFNIHYTAAKDGHVRVALYDLNGRLAEVLWEGRGHAGDNILELPRSRELSGGVYFMHIRAGEFFSERKVIVE